MTVSQSRIAADIAHIFSDLAATDATVTATFYQANGTTSRGTATVVRGIQLTSTELRDSGFADQYAESVYVQGADDPGVQREDVMLIGSAYYRVLRVAPGPMGQIVRCDLGDRWQ